MFWQNFERLCTKAGKSPTRVAAELGLTSGSVAGWKKGAAPRNGTVKQIADYFGVPLESLTAGEPPDLPQASPALEPDEAQLLTDYRAFSYAGRGLIRDFIEKMKAQGIYAKGADPFLMGFNEEWAQ